MLNRHVRGNSPLICSLASLLVNNSELNYSDSYNSISLRPGVKDNGKDAAMEDRSIEMHSNWRASHIL